MITKTDILRFITYTVFALALVNVAVSAEPEKKTPGEIMTAELNKLDIPVDADSALAILSQSYGDSWNVAELILDNRLKAGVDAVKAINKQRSYAMSAAELRSNAAYVIRLSKQKLRMSVAQWHMISDNCWNLRRSPGITEKESQEAAALTGIIETMLGDVAPDS